MAVAEKQTFTPESLRAETVAVYGYGRTGQAVADILAGTIGVSELWVLDDSPENIKDIEGGSIRVSTDNHPLERLDRIIVSPGIPADHTFLQRARAEGVPIWGELELADRLLDTGTIWAITGTNGKSTCVELAGQFLRAQQRTPFVGGNRGKPLIEAVAEDESFSDYVVEVSSFQVEGLKQFRPDHALLTNLGDDHLDRHGSLEVYHRLKWGLLSRTPSSGRLAWPLSSEAPFRHQGKTIRFDKEHAQGLPYRLEWDGRGLVVGTDRIEREEIPLSLQLFPENLLSVIGLIFDEPDSETIRRGLDDFTPLPYRAETVEATGGIDVINDSKATNPHAVFRLLRQTEAPFRLVLGGAGKDADFARLFKSISVNPPEEIVLCAEESLLATLKQECESHGLTHRIESDWKTAVQSTVDRAAVGETVLLSPGGTSFDAFENYKERGRLFEEWVREAVQS